MNFRRTYENILSNRKRFFLIGNSVFWLCIGIGNVIIEPPQSVTFNELSRPFRLLILGFLTFYPLRYIFKRYNCHRLSLFRIILIVLIGSIAVGVLWSYVQLTVCSYLYGIKQNLNPLLITRSLYLNSFAGILYSSLYLSYKIWEEWNDQKYQLEHERALLKTSQLEMLKYQLNPHFLFNTLSSLRGLIMIDQMKAREMVTQISEFLRYSLLEGKNNEVQLIKEIEIIKQYLNIEQVRYDEDLLVEFDIAPETNDFMIPIFLVYPLVENAVKHGMQTSQLPLRISIHSQILDSSLVIKVKNSGKWIDNEKIVRSNGTGIGLQNIQKRLEHYSPQNYTFNILKELEFIMVVIKINFEKK